MRHPRTQLGITIDEAEAIMEPTISRFRAQLASAREVMRKIGSGRRYKDGPSNQSHWSAHEATRWLNENPEDVA